jgi:hypothetical protein
LVSIFLHLITTAHQAEAVRRLQLEGPKKKSLFASKVNQRCIVGMVGDGVNDAPVRLLLSLLTTFELTSVTGFNSR